MVVVVASAAVEVRKAVVVALVLAAVGAATRRRQLYKYVALRVLFLVTVCCVNQFIGWRWVAAYLGEREEGK